MAKKTQTKNKNLPFEIIKQILALATSGFGLVAALAWNNVIQELVNTYIKALLPSGSGIISLIIYAIIITVLAVVITIQLSKVADRLEHPTPLRK